MKRLLLILAMFLVVGGEAYGQEPINDNELYDYIIENYDKKQLYHFILENYKNSDKSDVVARLTEKKLEEIGLSGYAKIYAIYLVAVAIDKSRDYEHSLEIIDSILEQKELITDERFLIDVLTMKGRLLQDLEREGDSMEMYEALIDSFPDMTNKSKSKIHYNLADLYENAWIFPKLEYHLDKSLQYAELAQDTMRIQRAYRSLAEMSLEVDDFKSAEKYLKMHGAFKGFIGEGMISYKSLQGRIHEENRRYKEAEKAYKEAAEYAKMLDFEDLEKAMAMSIYRNENKRISFFWQVFWVSVGVVFTGSIFAGYKLFAKREKDSEAELERFIRREEIYRRYEQ